MHIAQAVITWLDDWSRGDVIAALGVLISIVTIVVALWGWMLRTWLTERRLIAEFGADLYLPEDITNATRYYVRPDATSVDMAQEVEEGTNIVATREDLFKAVERFIDEESVYRHMLLLADSGMGKSSFILNYYDYNRRKWFNRYKLAVIPLGHRRALEKIKQIDKPNQTILFLDAFDEDPEARRGYEIRLNELMQACSEFRRVLITCRTQFFSKDSSIPKVAGLVFAPRTGQAQHTFGRLYLAPFSDRQVNTFLRRRFWPWELGKKRKARTLARKVPKLTVRPMLLTHIPDFLNTDKQVSTAWDIYEVMIDKWYEREVGFWKKKDDLKRFSEEVAVQFYLSFLRTGADRVPRERITEILFDLMFVTDDIDEWNATSRSLLHRDVHGNWKFAHRSIMEFLFLKRFFEGDGRCHNVRWSDQMKSFITENNRIENRPVFVALGPIRGADLSEVDLSGMNLSSAELRGANFSRSFFIRANLNRAILTHSDLTGANLTGAQLKEVDFRYVKLDDANLSDADLDRAIFKSKTLRGVILSRAKLTYADLTSVEFAGANLTGARFFGSDLTEAKLFGASLNLADLTALNLTRMDLHGAVLTSAILKGANLSQSDLSGTDLSRADLRGANLCNADIRRAKLSNADFRGADLSGADFSGSILSAANLSGLDLRRTILRAIDFSGIQCSGADLRGLNLSGADLSRSYFADANFSGANLSMANLAKTDLSRSNLSSADLRNAILKEAILNEANLNEVIMNEADLRGANLNNVKFLTKENLSEAIIDANTALPTNLE